MTDLRMLYVTTKSAADAKAIARELLKRRLIACANVLPQMESLYQWKGEINTESEAILLLKTTAVLAEAATKAVEELHEYETPCVLAVAIDSGSQGYMAWLHSALGTA